MLLENKPKLINKLLPLFRELGCDIHKCYGNKYIIQIGLYHIILNKRNGNISGNINSIAEFKDWRKTVIEIKPHYHSNSLLQYEIDILIGGGRFVNFTIRRDAKIMKCFSILKRLSSRYANSKNILFDLKPLAENIIENSFLYPDKTIGLFFDFFDDISKNKKYKKQIQSFVDVFLKEKDEEIKELNTFRIPSNRNGEDFLSP